MATTITAIILSALAIIAAVLAYIRLNKSIKALELSVRPVTLFLRFDAAGNAYFSEGVTAGCGFVKKAESSESSVGSTGQRKDLTEKPSEEIASD